MSDRGIRGVQVPVGNELLQRLLKLEALIGAYGPNGNPAQQLHTAYDTSGNLKARFGNLANGDHGIGAVDTTNGVQRTVQPVYHALGLTTAETANSNIWQTLAGSPSVTALIGNNCDAKISISCSVVSPGSTTAFIILTVDGITGIDALFCVLGDSANATPHNATISTTFHYADFAAAGIATPLAPGSVTFGLGYGSTSSTNCTFQWASLTVEPV